jgi:hypothetical protein
MTVAIAQQQLLPRCSGRVGSSCSTSVNRRITLVPNTVLRTSFVVAAAVQLQQSFSIIDRFDRHLLPLTSNIGAQKQTTTYDNRNRMTYDASRAEVFTNHS